MADRVTSISRLILISVLEIIVLGVLYVQLRHTLLTTAAFGFALAPIFFAFGTLGKVSEESRNRYLTNAAFPLLVLSYAVPNFLISALIVILDQIDVWSMPVGWFCLLHIAIFASFVWKILAADAGQEEIERTEKAVKHKTSRWKQLSVHAEKLLNAAPSAYRREAEAVRDAFRYSDPCSSEKMEEEEHQIIAAVNQFSVLLCGGDAEAVRKQQEEVLRLIEDRNNKIKMGK